MKKRRQLTYKYTNTPKWRRRQRNKRFKTKEAICCWFFTSGWCLLFLNILKMGLRCQRQNVECVCVCVNGHCFTSSGIAIARLSYNNNNKQLSDTKNEALPLNYILSWRQFDQLKFCVFFFKCLKLEACFHLSSIEPCT